MIAKKNFKLRDRVVIRRVGADSLEGAIGTIQGTSVVDATDFYIVLLDEPTATHLAICMTESCLDLVDE